MPQLETGANLLTMPPRGNERASAGEDSEPTMALEGSANPLAQNGNPAPIATGQETSLQAGATFPGEQTAQIMPADGVMRGEFSGSSLAFSDFDGLVCAGRLLGHVYELNQGISVPVNCSDGSAGSVKIIDLISPDQVKGLLRLGDTRTSPVLLIRSASLD